MAPHLVIVGADKGGVGKTTIARTLRDYYQSHGMTARAFDGEHSAKHPVTGEVCGVLARFHPDAVIVNMRQSDDQVKVFDGLRSAQVTLLDLPAAQLSDTLRLLSELGFMDGVKEGRLRTSIIHVIGSNQASLDEISAVSRIVEGARHHLIANHINDSKFMGLTDDHRRVGAGLIAIGKLNELAADTVDRIGIGFAQFIADQSQSETLRGYVRAWLRRTFAAYDTAALNAL